MSAVMLVRELLDKVYHWHRVPSSVKAKAVLLYFRGMSLRNVQKYLSDEGHRVSIEAIREWFHSVGWKRAGLCICQSDSQKGFITLYTLLEVKS